ncbi:AAA domain-containing protein [Pseudomonas azotoformans]|nr:AAA domain-containing protein [Pseudomonas azotoformans]
MLKTLAVANYRSINKWVVPLDRLNLITGPNGSGKSNLYRALRLLAETAQGASDYPGVPAASRLIAALQQDEGCNSIVLEKVLGETRIVGQGILDAPPGIGRSKWWLGGPLREQARSHI